MIEDHPGGIRDVLTSTKSQVIGIAGLQAIGYTLGRLLFPWFKKNCVAWVPVPRGPVHVPVLGTWVQQWYVPIRTLTYHERCFRTGYFIKKIGCI